MAIATFIIVGALLVSSTLIASMLIQRRAELASRRRAGGNGIDEAVDNEPDEYTARLRRGLRSRLSHELRTPLNSIISLSQMLMDEEAGVLSKEQRRRCRWQPQVRPIRSPLPRGVSCSLTLRSHHLASTNWNPPRTAISHWGCPTSGAIHA